MRYASASAYKNLRKDCETVMSLGDIDMHRICHRNYDLHQSEGLADLPLPLHAGVSKLVLCIQHQL